VALDLAPGLYYLAGKKIVRGSSRELPIVSIVVPQDGELEHLLDLLQEAGEEYHVRPSGKCFLVHVGAPDKYSCPLCNQNFLGEE